MEELGYALLGTVGILFTFIAVDYTRRRNILNNCENCGNMSDRCTCSDDEHWFIG
jgi:hypothetical protein